jgi:two-component system sensor histidine kinase HydH
VEHARLPAEVAVDVIVPPGLPALQVDRSQMTQVFANLLLNAAQAMGQRGTVTVSAAQRDGRVEVAVADKGTGIAPENMGRLFEPLFSTKTFGVGLGLAICRSFVEAHGGTIVVESEPGKGAKFTVALPVEQSGGTRC